LPLSRRRTRFLHDRYHRCNRATRIIDTGHRLPDLKRTRFVGDGIHLFPVIESVRDVAIFLYFEHDHVAQRMHGAGRDEDAVAGIWRERLETFRHSAV
jgi:predicted mannosyl-3-phosphoglycerate phosphatase (HAD superfamily)